jgi:hypothetical protein
MEISADLMIQAQQTCLVLAHGAYFHQVNAILIITNYFILFIPN